MWIKEKDPKFSGVDLEKFYSAKPIVNEEMLRRYAYYQKERTAIYVKKEIEKSPKPWSDNTMFQDFKFTMTKRWLDRESRNLINGVLNREDISFENKILNCVVFRLVNRWKSFELLPGNYIDFYRDWKESDWKELRDHIFNSGIKGIYTDAYFVSGTLRALKIKLSKTDDTIVQESNPYDSLITLYKYVLVNKELILSTLNEDTPDGIVVALSNIYGLGKFLSFQIFSDWSYIKEFSYSDNAAFSVGPGTERGLKHFFDDFDGLSLKEAIYWVRENIQRLCDERDIEWDLESWFWFLEPHQRTWTLGDIGNSFCEFDKTTRIWTKELQDLNRKRVRKYDLANQKKVPKKLMNCCSIEANPVF